MDSLAFVALLLAPGTASFNSIEWIPTSWSSQGTASTLVPTFNSIEWIHSTGNYDEAVRDHLFQFHWMDSLEYARAQALTPEQTFNSIEWIRGVELGGKGWGSWGLSIPLNGFLHKDVCQPTEGRNHFQFHWMDSCSRSPSSWEEVRVTFNSIEWIQGYQLIPPWLKEPIAFNSIEWILLPPAP